ncbi:hypothetical protein [Micromonospora sp. NBC_01739]|uniref:hypothetical protein n=1 Tax=Micromonospora sp. NBC_01739 TaxID=2975985 RepID=UPI002E11EBE3|nr:hypothetical protein OIE53_23280 [Micromonospora sp. NBC_01739]
MARQVNRSSAPVARADQRGSTHPQAGCTEFVALRIHKPAHSWLTDSEAEAELLTTHLP